MAKSLKQQLLERPDAREKSITVGYDGEEPLTCSIKRITIAERDRLMKDYGFGSGDKERAAEAQCALVAAVLVPADGETYTTEEVRGWPAAIVDSISLQAMEFNGWTIKGKAALDDQFRPSA